MYKSALSSLRSQLSSPATPVSGGLISPRALSTQAPDDLLGKSAEWLKQIRGRADQLKKVKSSTEEAPPSFLGGLAGGMKDAQEAKSRKEGFIERRKDASPSAFAPKRSFETPVPVDAEVRGVLDALAAVESRGSGDYVAVGPVVDKGMYKGQRAYGRYQVMEGNIGPWTEEALGKRLTKEEFLADTDAQDAVATFQLQRSKDKHGTWEDAASVWFSGRPLSSAGSASDGYTTVPEYISKFRQNFKRS